MSKQTTSSTVEGVVLRKSIRATFASVDICFDEKVENHIVVLIQLRDKNNCFSLNQQDDKELRSYLRRTLVLGNRLKFQYGNLSIHDDDRFPRYCITYHKDCIVLLENNCFDKHTCQSLIQRIYPMQQQMMRNKNTSTETEISSTVNPHPLHGGKVGKRDKGNIVVDFILRIILAAISRQGGVSMDEDPFMPWTPSTTASSFDRSLHSRFQTLVESSTPPNQNPSYTQVLQYLNTGTGVMDICGGSGHVSLAFGLHGVQSTVMDPRLHVGKLPMRDKKVLRKAIQRSKHNTTMTQPMEFSSIRAWFLSKPTGVDEKFRRALDNDDDDDDNDDDDPPVICSMCSQDNLLPNCSFIVGLHPDEATGDIVDFAVNHRIPFMIVPCCVFARLYPTRYKPIWTKPLDSSFSAPENEPRSKMVTTYDDLIEYLLAKDPSIKLSPLDFDGAHSALWSLFETKFE